MKTNTTHRRRGIKAVAAIASVAALGWYAGNAAAEGNVGSVERIVFDTGEDSASFRDYSPGTTNRYLVRASAGQTMAVEIAPADSTPTFDIHAPDGTALALDQTSATVTLPVDGDYIIDVTPPAGDDSDFRLTTWIPSTTGGGGDTDSGIGSVERIVFQNASSASFRDYSPGTTNRYLIRGGPNQTMTVHIDPADSTPTFDVYSPDGTLVADDQTSASVSLVAEGDYVIDVTPPAGDDSDFRLSTWIS